MEDDFYWTTNTMGIGFGQISTETTFGFENQERIFSFFDTGTSFTFIPSSIWFTFKEKLLAMANLNEMEEQGGYILFLCSETYKFPTLYFMIDFYWFEMDPNDYILSLDESVCTLALVGSEGG